MPKLVPRKALPKELVMDLIAITRLLYAKEQEGGGHPVKLQEITDIGKSLKVALDMAVTCGPGTMGQGTAWSRTEEALERLCDLLKEEQATTLLRTLANRMLKLKQSM